MKWSNAFKIVFATLMVALGFLLITILVLQSDMTFHAQASIGLKIEPTKEVVAEPTMSDWITLPLEAT